MFNMKMFQYLNNKLDTSNVTIRQVLKNIIWYMRYGPYLVHNMYYININCPRSRVSVCVRQGVGWGWSDSWVQYNSMCDSISDLFHVHFEQVLIF